MSKLNRHIIRPLVVNISCVDIAGAKVLKIVSLSETSTSHILIFLQKFFLPTILSAAVMAIIVEIRKKEKPMRREFIKSEQEKLRVLVYHEYR